MLSVLLTASALHAQTTAKPDKIMTREELRACMKMKQVNDASAAAILQEQQGFSRDQDAVKAEQAEVNKANEEMRTRAVAITTERDAMAAVVTDLSAKAQNAKTDAEKADYEAERTKLVERNRVHQQAVESFNATQQTLRTRIDTLNERVVAINQRGATINDRVEPQQKQAAAWKDQCGNRRYREEDEILIKKELASGK
jgi:hypothetical protein